ncbi:MAG TPA: hypothetical protein VK574_19595 [Terracidiphilus sp.]|nr:hypothetical protein [Terracidiphilus sp.]
MALTHDYTIVCEMVRPEMGGKFVIVGLFPNGIGTPVVPFPMPLLTFFTLMKADAPGTYNYSGKLSPLATGREISPIVRGVIQAPAVGPAILVHQIMSPQFTAFGTHTWEVEIEGQEPFVTQFEVTRVAPQQIRVR